MRERAMRIERARIVRRLRRAVQINRAVNSNFGNRNDALDIFLVE
jgi:hypothetical protein